ncbi:integrase core domain-containing protein, partial [Burkholderia pseudomallei]
VLASRPFRASLSSAQDHEHDISNAPLATPVYTVSNFNSLLKALRRAYDHRRPLPGLMFHSDQGCQYTSTRFLAELRARGTIQSMSRRGNCWDNAVVERFFRSLKNEWIGDQLYVDHRHAEQDITDYLVDFYNHRRLHSAAKGLRQTYRFGVQGQ